jgi:CO/xanthine dehydrogenase Mo-binding subunit
MMNEFRNHGLTRRGLLAGSGALVVSFSLSGLARGQITQTPQQPTPVPVAPKAPELPGALESDPYLDSWIRIDADGQVTVFTGKAELGQGLKTAIRQCAAEELKIDPMSIKLITADTGLTPNEGFTAGSMSMQNSGTAVRNAAAQVRELLIGQAATKLGVDPGSLHAEAGKIVGGPQPTPYGALVADQMLHVEAQPQSKLTPTDAFTVMGKPLARVDIPGKVTGGVAYVQDLRLDGMLHGRVVRPPSYKATLVKADIEGVGKMPGVVKVVRDGSYLGVIAEGEWQAIKAMRTLARSAKWNETTELPDFAHLPDALRALPIQDGIVADTKTAPTGVTKTFEAWFTRPYQMHGSIGPSCAVGVLADDGTTTVYTHTQGVYPDRDAIAEMLGVDKAKVRCVHTEGSGCYGHNGADDAAADAALLARAVPGKPVRVQFMREQEHAWEPYGPAMVTHLKAGIDADGKIAAWDYELWSNSHGTRPGSAGELVSARYLAKPFPEDPQKLRISSNGSGDRNADPGYTLPQKHVVWHFMADMPVRVSSLRALGAYCNVFSLESGMDELAILAGADPVEFRLKHMDDPRGQDVIKLAAKNFDWAGWKPKAGRGRGFAYARYKNHAAYLAVALEVEVDRDSGFVRVVRVNAAIDSGEIVNPDGIKNQTEGGIIQSMSWTLFEQVTFDKSRITSIDWQTYPIARFGSIPDSIDVAVIGRPGQPFLGTGEAAQGPTPAAIANAIRDAIGVRIHDLPFRPDRVKAAILGELQPNVH